MQTQFNVVMSRYTLEQQYKIINKIFIKALKQDRHAPNTIEEFAEWCESVVNE